MTQAKEILSQYAPSVTESKHIQYHGVLQAMEAYAAQFKPAPPVSREVKPQNGLVDEMASAMQEFVDRCDRGEVRSTYTYKKFKALLNFYHASAYPINGDVEKIEEYILCAAVLYEDGIVYDLRPDNIETGLVVCGRRHGDCYMTILGLKPDYAETATERDNQGFMSSKNRYVDRVEAYQIAKAAGQLLMNLDEQEKPQLISENLY